MRTKRIYEKSKRLMKRICVSALVVLLIITGVTFPSEIAVVKAAETQDAKGLKSDSEVKSDIEALGFSTEQKDKQDPAGKIVDKKKSNPLGGSNVSLNRILGLAVSGMQSNDKDYCSVYKNPITTSFVDLSQPNIVASLNPNEQSAYAQLYSSPKAMTSADLDGEGTQEVVTAVLAPVMEKNAFGVKVASTTKVSFQIIVRKYLLDQNKNSSKYNEVLSIVSTEIPKPNSTLNVNLEYPIYTAAGDFNHDDNDEIAVVIGSTLYTLKADNNYNVRVISQFTFTNQSNQIGLSAADVNKDGFEELLVSTASFSDANAKYSTLLIYNSDTVASPNHKIDLSFTIGKEKIYFVQPSVDVGDVFGEGKENIVIGGLASDGKIYLASAIYDAKTETYDSNLSNKYYEVAERGKTPSNLWGITSKFMGLKCVSLTTSKPGDTQYVELGGSLFKYDKDEKKFIKKNCIDSVFHDNASGRSNNSDGMTDIACDGDGKGPDDTTYILGTYVGNFDGNLLGKEQIVMLNLNLYQKTSQINITWCGADDKGNIITYSKCIWAYGMAYTYPAICAPDVFNNATTLIYEPEKSEYTFSSPSVIAVLGASPYYKEIAEKSETYSGALSNVSTTFGKEIEKINSNTDGVNIHAGISFGYKNEQDLLGLMTIDEVSFETEISYSFTTAWTSSKSISKGVTFSNNLGGECQDTVVIMSIPYDIFHYKVIGADGSQTEMTINVPYDPLVQQMSVDNYNEVVKTKNIIGAPIITEDVLHHVVGDPRTYPKSTGDIPNIGKSLTGDDFLSVGNGTNSQAEQSITLTEANEKSYDHNLDISASLSVNVAGFTVGASFGAGYTTTETSSESMSTQNIGSVAGLPQEYMNKNFGFKWKLAMYNYNLPLYGVASTQECHVVSYLVKHISNDYPPRIPQNLKTASKKLNEVTLSWDEVANSAGYRISRSDSLDGEYSDIGESVGIDNISFIDKSAKAGNTFYYKVRAYNGSDGLDSETKSSYVLSVKNIGVTSSPNLSYMVGEALDLSKLSVKLIYSDKTEQIVSYKDFTNNNLTVSMADGSLLKDSDNKSPITITYNAKDGSPIVYTLAGNITVYSVSSIAIAAPPKLFYNSNDLLDLSKLEVILKFSNDTQKTIAFKDFTNNNLSVSEENKRMLTISDNGIPITVTYRTNDAKQPINIDTDKIRVYEEGAIDLLLTAVFNVGANNNVTVLSPNEQLEANITITNNQDTPKDALIMLALYDNAGSMVNMTYGTIKVEPMGSESTVKQLKLVMILPEDANNGYTVKVFAWDGTDINNTNQIPESNIIQIP